VTKLGINLFGGCMSLESITVDEANPVYRSENNCIILKENNTLIAGCIGSVIPDGVIGIVNYAFYSLYTLENITIPKSIKEIGFDAFRFCTNLTSITFEGTVEEWNAVILKDNWNYKVPAENVICSDGSVSLK
jgi:hypothetical protein